MKKTLLALIFLIPIITFSQTENSNLELIDKVKIQKSGKEISKLLVGEWEFVKLTDHNGNVITERKHSVSEPINATEKIIRPNIKIHNTGEYEFLNCNKSECEKGTWKYDETEKVLRLTFDKPQYNVDIDKLAPGLFEKLKESGSLIEFTENIIEIAELSKSELIIIEHLPHNQYEFKYNLRIYKKK